MHWRWPDLGGGTEGEVVERLGWAVEQVQDVKETVLDTTSLRKPISREEESSRLEDLIVDETLCDRVDAVGQQELGARVPQIAEAPVGKASLLQQLCKVALPATWRVFGVPASLEKTKLGSW